MRQVLAICTGVLAKALAAKKDTVSAVIRQQMYLAGKAAVSMPMHGMVGDHPRQLFPTITRPALPHVTAQTVAACRVR